MFKQTYQTLILSQTGYSTGTSNLRLTGLLDYVRFLFLSIGKYVLKNINTGNIN